MKKQTYRRMCLDSLLFDLKWFLRHALIGRDRKAARWYWAVVKQDLYYLWKHRFDTSLLEVGVPEQDKEYIELLDALDKDWTSKF